MINIFDKEFDYPVLCISIVGNYLVFTTKKTGSRYFEDISSDILYKTKKNSINFYIEDAEGDLENSQGDDIDLYHNFFNYRIYPIRSHDLLELYEFNNLLKIDKISDIFSDKVMKNFEYVFITRNPIDRLLTGFFEKIGSIISVLETDNHNQFLFNIIKNHFGITEYIEFNNLSQDKINLILNEFALSINYRLLNDEHLSLWNYFLIEFLHKTNLHNKVQIIDLNDSSKMNIFNKISQPSNKPWLSNWLSDENNKYYIDTMLLNLKPYMDLEIQSYNKLLNK
jgi:hypothetical protein